MVKINRILPILMFSMVFYACGGNNSTGSQNQGTTITNATFTAIQQEVFTPSCAIAGCHNGSEQPALSSGAAYNNIVNIQSTQGLDYIEPGDPDNSYLFRKLTGTGISGLRMPRGGTALSSAVIDSIRAWIVKGAPNN